MDWHEGQRVCCQDDLTDTGRVLGRSDRTQRWLVEWDSDQMIDEFSPVTGGVHGHDFVVRPVPPTHAITLWPEWAHAVAHLGKDVENRCWPPPRWLVGKRIAIHAGAHVGGRKGRVALHEGLDALRGMMLRAGVTGRPNPDVIALRQIVATATVGEPVRDSPSPWAVPGEWHWPLLGVQRVSVPWQRGAQGLWRLPEGVEL